MRSQAFEGNHFRINIMCRASKKNKRSNSTSAHIKKSTPPICGTRFKNKYSILILQTGGRIRKKEQTGGKIKMFEGHEHQEKRVGEG